MADLSSLDSVRLRIVGSAFCLGDSERSRFGATEYLLVREPENDHDTNAIGVYGRGRQVGYVSAARARMLAPILDGLEADAYRVAGEGPSRSSSRMWIDVPKVDALRLYAAERLRDS